MSLSNYPPGVTGNEPQIAGYDEIEAPCTSCDRDLIYYGDRHQADSECPTCGEVTIYPQEAAEHDAAEARGDAMRDGDW